jgi:hypothetical protein
MVTTEYRRDHATLAALCRLSSNDAGAIFGDRMQSTLNRFWIVVYADDKMEFCRFCRDRVVPVSRGSAWRISLCWRAYRDAADLEWKPVGRAFAIKLPKNDIVN